MEHLSHHSSGFVQISPDYLKSITVPKGDMDVGTETTPMLYFHNNPGIRNFFWWRLKVIGSLLKKYVAKENKTICDLGGGNGVLMPTLSGLFESVTCWDLNTGEADRIIEDFKLSNVKTNNADFTKASDDQFDVIVAADTLEHFKELNPVVTELLNKLRPQGWLVTSLPTENWLYALLRLIFSITKPFDHYHTAAEVESFLQEKGFQRVKTKSLPIPIFCLFKITLWKKMK